MGRCKALMAFYLSLTDWLDFTIYVTYEHLKY
jgi:hypothetical protein